MVKDGRELARLRSEYRGDKALPRDAYHIHTVDLPVDRFYNTFEIDSRNTTVIDALLG
jgi:hypothetical protein